MAFKRGESGNPGGRPRGAKNLVTQQEFITALHNVQKKRKINLLERFFERALKSDTVLIAVMKKLIPDLKALDMRLDLLVMQNKISGEEAKEIRSKLANRMDPTQKLRKEISVNDDDFIDVNPLPNNLAEAVMNEVEEDEEDED